MAKIHLKDNSEVKEDDIKNSLIQFLANRNLENLAKENLIIFPPTIKESKDLKPDNYIFTSHNGQVWTRNIIGIIKKGDDELQITSRFHKTNQPNEDYFLRYLLQKVLHYNVMKEQVSASQSNDYYDLLIYLFPLYLGNALKKGVYKEYVERTYNDANIKGPIQLARHIKQNVPFMGKVAYKAREFSYDNKVTQLVRHTMDYIQKERRFDLEDDLTIKENIRAIKQETPTYVAQARYEIVRENVLDPVRHGYFVEYYDLQQLCIQILRQEKIGFADDTDKINGIIIDVAWLWEEYLATLLVDFEHSFEHPKGNESIYQSCSSGQVRPDFYNDKIVIDAKYKLLADKTIKREDRFQIISYLHYRNAEKAGILYPATETKLETEGILKGMGGEIFKQSLAIPQNSDTYDRFVKTMKNAENDLKKDLSSYLN
ncbi:3-isopropylmalate dehydrogenase [Bacilli bacterium]|nr:3-isopropylmalate dehydrogenase [Bacilli bacterium]GHU43910.1 3-isopropylmalate dehydrogenase [Bacilli bacterium]